MSDEKKYNVNGNLKHNGTVYKAGDVVEMTADQAGRVGSVVSPLSQPKPTPPVVPPADSPKEEKTEEKPKEEDSSKKEEGADVGSSANDDL